MSRIMVTGAGGIYGEAIIRSLRESPLSSYLLAVDCLPNASGFFLADQAQVVPRVKDTNYLDVVGKLARRHDIDMVFIASGAEIPVLAPKREILEEACDAFVVLNSPQLLDISEDKWKTVEFLKGQGLEAPESTISTDPEELTKFAARVGFPMVVKPRSGDGSQGLLFCEEESALIDAMSSDRMIAQQQVGDSESEYTVGVLGTEEGEILGSIAFRRLLGLFGRTVYAEVVDHAEITSYCEAITRLLKPRGYCNIQLRLHQGRPVAFEINGRVSSSTGFRTSAGFNEAEILIRHYLLKQSTPRFVPRPMRLVRVHQELVLGPGEADI